MDDRFGNRNRNCNSDVRFDLGVFTKHLFAILGAESSFNGPGPVELEWRGSDTTPEDRFAIEHLAKELYSKYDDKVSSPEKREKAIQRFREGEVLCALTNCKFLPTNAGQVPAWLDDFAPFPDLPEDRAVFARARQIISKVLGAFPGWDAVLQCADFGPGSTTRLTARRSHRSNKWSGRPHVTPFSLSALNSVFASLPLLESRLEGSGAEICPGNKLSWVPKNYKTDRTIATEPDWNMFLQKGVGTLIRRKLKRVRQDLDDQTTNQFLAAVGSIDGSLCTIDMSMASDTVAYRLVEYLVRPDWFSALEQLRCPVGFYTHSGNDDQTKHVLSQGDNHAVFYEKFSSMGNGYTFELESLIFYGLLRAVSELTGEADRRLYVYGDDVVMPVGMAAVGMEYLRKAGFLVNADKSFVSGPFRESCGGHYFKGTDVTPFYIREPVTKLDRLFLLHNNVYRWFNKHPGICSVDEIQGLLDWIRSFAPSKWRKPRLLTEDVGDGAFIGSWEEVSPKAIGRSRRKAGWEGWRSETLQYRDVRDASDCSDECSCERCQFPRGSGPDLAALWALEGKSSEFPQRGTLQYFAGLLAAEAVAVSRKVREVPLPLRRWYVATQVLPWKPGRSWWWFYT